MGDNSLTHYGVLGMKWGKRKSKASNGSNVKKSKSSSKKSSNLKKKIKRITSKVDKEKVKSIAKTSAVVAGSIAATATLGYFGGMAFREISTAIANGTPMIGNRTTVERVSEEWGPIEGGRNKSGKSFQQIVGDVPLSRKPSQEVMKRTGLSDEDWRKYLSSVGINNTRKR